MQQRDSARKAASSAAAAICHGPDPFGVSQVDDSKQSAVTQTASWLERAKSALQEPGLENAASQQVTAEVLQTQMHEVQRLINEGPVIQQTSAGLSHSLDQYAEHPPSSGGSDTEPADKRLRTAEGAEALVGFIRSVRESAAATSGQDL
jgi:hypothetical protein